MILNNTQNVSLMPINTDNDSFNHDSSTAWHFLRFYLTEYARRGNRLESRITAETLSGIPSLFMVFWASVFVTTMRGDSPAGWWITLDCDTSSDCETTEEALHAVPDSYREGSYDWRRKSITVFTIVHPLQFLVFWLE